MHSAMTSIVPIRRGDHESAVRTWRGVDLTARIKRRKAVQGLISEYRRAVEQSCKTPGQNQGSSFGTVQGGRRVARCRAKPVGARVAGGRRDSTEVETCHSPAGGHRRRRGRRFRRAGPGLSAPGSTPTRPERDKARHGPAAATGSACLARAPSRSRTPPSRRRADRARPGSPASRDAAKAARGCARGFCRAGSQRAASTGTPSRDHDEADLEARDYRRPGYEEPPPSRTCRASLAPGRDGEIP